MSIPINRRGSALVILGPHSQSNLSWMANKGQGRNDIRGKWSKFYHATQGAATVPVEFLFVQKLYSSWTPQIRPLIILAIVAHGYRLLTSEFIWNGIRNGIHSTSEMSISDKRGCLPCIKTDFTWKEARSHLSRIFSMSAAIGCTRAMNAAPLSVRAMFRLSIAILELI